MHEPERQRRPSRAGKWMTLAPMPAGRHAFGLAVVDSTLCVVAGAYGSGGMGMTPDMIAFTLS